MKDGWGWGLYERRKGPTRNSDNFLANKANKSF